MAVHRFGFCARGVALVGVALVWSSSAAAPAWAGQHPRLLIRADDIPRLRHACGVGAAPAEGLGRAGARAKEFQALRAYFAKRGDGEPLPGELTGAAFLHLVDPDDPFDAKRIGLINHALRQPVWVAGDVFETLVALDWCWDALEPGARREFLFALRKRAELLTAADSPLDHRTFAGKLTTLAAALVVDTEDDPSPTWAALRARVLAAARAYYANSFPTFVSWRGLAPTSPTAGPWEERDTALAVELGSYLLERDLWAAQRDTVGRWLEHYVFASFAHPVLQQHFHRDDGNRAPLSPAPQWKEMLPVTAHLIATRTQDPAASFIARRVEQRLRGPAAEPLAVPWQWVPVVFETSGVRRCDFSRLPAARNFGGAVVLRGRRGPTEVGIWIEAGQPFLRRRQHFDAGHFLIHSGGKLTVAGGDDIALEAVPSKRGSQHLGRRGAPFDFEQYFTSSVAHNCLLAWDAVRVPRWYGERYVPAGGQRLVEHTCADFSAPLDGHQRQTGRQLAYGQSGDNAYLALDLAPAYERRVLSGYTREFVFLGGTALLVIDRVRITRGRAAPVWIVNIPARPTVDGQELADAARIHGSENQAGVWQYDAATSLRWRDADGCLWMRPLLPDPRRLHVAGGPGNRLVIPDGPYTGRTYLGGSAEGFERLVGPAGHTRPQNAWYHLGQPTLLGPAFASNPHWGRIEVEPAQAGDTHVFITVLVVETSDALREPGAVLKRSDQAIDVELDTGSTRATLHLRTGDLCGGTVAFPGGTPTGWALPTRVEPDDALPTD